MEPIRQSLRQRWELASVLSFLHVFEPVIQSDLKITAEDIETALIEQNDTLSQIHIALLKGIVSNRKMLTSSDWIVTLSRTLSEWWPWVATGEFPLTGAKGEEKSVYQDLEATTRLLILKALCEVRADQYDSGTYVNEVIKENGDVSNFRKQKLAGDGNGISFWYDGNETIGHRLYKEVQIFENESFGKGTVQVILAQWETLAINLEEFKKIANEFSSSGAQLEVAVSKCLESDAIPVLERQWKKKQRALHQKQREQMRLNGFRSSRLTRSSHNQKAIDYRFDNYDKSISEAIQYDNKRKREEKRHDEKLNQRKKDTASNKSNNLTPLQQMVNPLKATPAETFIKGKTVLMNPAKKIMTMKREKTTSVPSPTRKKFIPKDKTCRSSTGPGNPISARGWPRFPATVSESINLGPKNRLRQRPSPNSALESTVVPDSEDESS